MKARNKIVVVTGAGNGIGREVALELLRRGAVVAGVDISKEKLEQTRALAGGDAERISVYVTNIAETKAVDKLATNVVKTHGAVDGYINVAGIIQKFVRINDLSLEDMQRVMDVNFWGTVNLAKSFLPILLSRPEGQIVNVSSMGGYVPVPGQTFYGATKAAVKLFTEGLRSELAGTKVGVSVVFPGAVATNISVNSGLMTEQQAKQQAAEAARKGEKPYKTTPAPVAGRLIVDAFESNPFHAFVGSDAKTMDRLSRLTPEKAAVIIQKNMANLLGESTPG